MLKALVVGVVVVVLAALASDMGTIANEPLESSGTVGIVPNRTSVWYQKPFGKFNVVPISPLQIPDPGETADLEQCIWVYDGPHPLSGFRRAIVVECTTNFAILFSYADGVTADSLVYEGVEPGWYAFLSNTERIAACRIESGERVIAEWELNQ